VPTPNGDYRLPGTARRMRDRQDAGHKLGVALVAALDAETLAARPIVLGLPRGGVVVAAAVATALELPLDAITVRKVAMPQNEELAVGAVTLDGPPLLNAAVVAAERLDSGEIAVMVDAARERVRRDEITFRSGRPPADVAGRPVIVVDDGAATGATVRAAIVAVRAKGATAVIVGLPVAPRETLQVLQAEADLVVCLQAPLLFRAVGWAYQDFQATPDEEVRELLSAAAES
jgi:predicted phosphoribosyltransferase